MGVSTIKVRLLQKFWIFALVVLELWGFTSGCISAKFSVLPSDKTIYWMRIHLQMQKWYEPLLYHYATFGGAWTSHAVRGDKVPFFSFYQQHARTTYASILVTWAILGFSSCSDDVLH